MAGASDSNALKDWSIRLCKWFWGKRSFVWSAVALYILLGIIVTLLFTDPSTLTKLPIGWVFQNPLIIITVFIILLSLTIISGLASSLPVTPSNKEVKRRYLNLMINKTARLTLQGIPAGLISESVPLDEVFIPSKFRPNRPLTDYPLTESELTAYRDRIRSGNTRPSETMERALVEAERNWQHILKQRDRISIADLWQRLGEYPALVIQGYPGMGKSTLMERLTLHMARTGLRAPDPDMPERLKPLFIPVLLRLGAYASERAKVHTLSLMQYLTSVLDGLQIPELAAFIRKSLDAGDCLVMFDGLDEVSDPQMRSQVQDAIKTFIYECDTGQVEISNRFLITSRVAGYDQAAFPDYAHYTIAELTAEQIDYFLPRWSRANVCRNYGLPSRVQGEQEEAITKEVEQRVKELKVAIAESQGVRELAENPLLLTLLAVMQQNSIVLPRQRIELYDAVTHTLLENRNIAKTLDPVSEVQAIQRLGPLAFQMQETGNSFARQREVMDSLVQTISKEGGTREQVKQEAESFLKRIRERGGLFVQRTGDYFGFIHRTFQEYFAARHILNEIKEKPSEWIKELVDRARRKDALWREPFLLAVAYQSKENEKVANEIIRVLLTAPQGANEEEQERDIILAAECLVEAKSLTIDATLEKQIVAHLLQIYEDAQRGQRFQACEQIEVVLLRRLISLPKDVYQPVLLAVLHDAMSDMHQVVLQRAILTLLTIIAQQLVSCPEVVFESLIPPLLALAGLPAVGKYQPIALLTVPDFNVADLALATLSFIGRRGPAGLLLADVRQHFKDHPEHLRHLARYSLESGSLITLAVVPLSEGNYRRYESAVKQWIALRDKQSRFTERDLEACLIIHQTLLDCAEEVCYPIHTLLLSMLQAAVSHADQPWQQIWLKYLSGQLVSGDYMHYQEVALLWIALFPEQQALQVLADLLAKHHNTTGQPVQRFARRFFATLSNDPRYLRNLLSLGALEIFRDLGDLEDLRILRDLRDLGDLGDLEYPRNPRDLRDLRNPRDLRDLRDLRYLGYLRYLGDLGDLQKLRYLEDLESLEGLGYLRDLRDLGKLRDLLLTKEAAEEDIKALTSINVASDPVEYVDLLTILLGRVLQIQKADEIGNAVEREIQRIAQIVIDSLASTYDDEVREALLDIVSYLPSRTENELSFMLQLAKDTNDRQIQKACASSLMRAEPKTPEAWAALESGRHSGVDVIRYAVAKRLVRKKHAV